MTNVEQSPEVKVVFSGNIVDYLGIIVKKHSSEKVDVNKQFNKVKTAATALKDQFDNLYKKQKPEEEQVSDVQFKPMHEEEGVSAEAVRMAEATLPPGFERVEINIDVKPNTDDIETVIKGGVVHRVIDGELIEESKLTPEDLQEAAKKLQEKFKK